MSEATKIRIGRGTFNDIVVDDESVLMEHCYIIHEKSGYRVVNLKKNSKSFVNDNEINWEADITPEDKLRVGNIDILDWKEAFLNKKSNQFQPDNNQEEITDWGESISEEQNKQFQPVDGHITCPQCGRTYPEDAIECPGCKHPNRHYAELFKQKGNTEGPSTEKKRHGFVTFWIWLTIIFNLIAIFIYSSEIKETFRFLSYQLIAPPFNTYNTEFLLKGIQDYENLLITSICVGSLLNIVFLAKLLHWKKLGFWGLVCTSLVSDIFMVVVGKMLMHYLMSYGLLLQFDVFAETEDIVIRSLVPIIIMWAVLQIRKNGVSCWKQLK